MRCWGNIKLLDGKELCADVNVLYLLFILLLYWLLRWYIELIFILLFILKAQMVRCLSVIIRSYDGKGPSTDVNVLYHFIYLFLSFGL